MTFVAAYCFDTKNTHFFENFIYFVMSSKLFFTVVISTHCAAINVVIAFQKY